MLLNRKIPMNKLFYLTLYAKKTGKTPLAKGELPVLSFVGELRRFLVVGFVFNAFLIEVNE